MGSGQVNRYCDKDMIGLFHIRCLDTTVGKVRHGWFANQYGAIAPLIYSSARQVYHQWHRPTITQEIKNWKVAFLGKVLHFCQLR